MKHKNETVKFYPAFFCAVRNLSLKGFKVLGYILEKVRPERDRFYFFHCECMRYTGYKSKKTIYEGLTELLVNGIIAKGTTEAVYFINPLALFKGDRLAFIKRHLNKLSVN